MGSQAAAARLRQLSNKPQVGTASTHGGFHREQQGFWSKRMGI